MNAIAVVFNVIVIVFLTYLYSKQSPSSKIVFWAAWILKLTSGVMLGLLYTYHYKEADTFVFFQDSVLLSKLARSNFGEYLNFLWSGDESYVVWAKLSTHQSRALFMAKVISLVNLLTVDNYWITSVYFSLLIFFCSWRLVTTLIQYFPEQRIAAIVSFLFVPSVVFWSSGIMKESIALACVFFLVHVFISFWMQREITIVDVVLSILFLWVLWQVKYYYLAVFVPVVCTSLVVKFALPLIKVKKIGYEVGLWFIIFFLFLYLISLSRFNFHFTNLAQVIVENHDTFLRYSRPDAVIHFNNLRPTTSSLLMNAPWALFSGFFRPFIWEVNNVFQVVFAIENFIILILFMGGFKYYKHVVQSSNRLLCLAALVYAFLLCIFVTLSTPNFGSLSRYRVGFFPFFVFLICSKNPFIAYFSNFIQRIFSHLVR